MNIKDKAKLKKLIKEKATRVYFVEKLRVHLSEDWKTNSINNTMHKKRIRQYIDFQDKIDVIDERILKLVPHNTHYKAIQFTITD